MSLSNPFPDFPVARLIEPPEGPREPTMPPEVTEAIKESRDRLEPYISGWLDKVNNPDLKINVPSTAVAVKGDFGSGKTRLLIDAIAQIEQRLSDSYPDITILRLPCIETSIDDWYRSTIGPTLKPQPGKLSFVEDLITHLYARAGEQVAQKVELTVPAVGKLQKDPHSIHNLIKDSMLNRTACDRVFQDLLRTACHVRSDELQRALGGLVWGDTSGAATRWLAGEELTSEEANLLQIAPSVFTLNDARDVLVALAGIHSYLDRPFGLMIDELEHLTRYDETHKRGKSNLTWLKRLLEELAQDETVLYVAGHLSAWKTGLKEGEGDLMGRFAQLTPITLDRPSPENVLNLTRAYVKDLSSEHFDRAEAETVLESTNGNMRRILTLLSVLFNESNGFRSAISKRQIIDLAANLKQRMSLEDASLYVRELLEERGLEVRSNDAPGTTNILFDLVAYREQPIIVVDFRHGYEQRDPAGNAKHFIIRMRELYEDVPGVIGCFVSAGHIDEEAKDLFRSEAGLVVYWFDLNEPDFRARFARNLTQMLQSEGARGTQLSTSYKAVVDRKAQVERQELVARAEEDTEQVKQLRSEREELEKQVKELREQLAARTISLEEKLLTLEQRRLQEYEEQRAWREGFARSMVSQRDTEIITAPGLRGELPSTLHTTYAELTAPVGFLTKLRLALDRGTIFALLVSVSIFLAFLAISPLLGQTPRLEGVFGRSANLILLDLALGGLLLLFTLVIVWLRVSAVEAYLDFATRMLREVYIRTQEPKELLRANSIIRESLERLGPDHALEEAKARLVTAMPRYFRSSRWRSERLAVEDKESTELD